jgi:putative tryptophan/tyrosine transport system substrate-binding protein
MIARRTFIAGLGAAAGSSVIWPLSTRAQRANTPVIGFLHSASPDGNADRVRSFREGLKEAGFVDGENVILEQRWADNQNERLPALAAELVRRQVAVIAAISGAPAAFAAKAATTTIPIVFLAPEDPVQMGLVTSLAHPAGNMTGINFFPAEVAAKRLELLRELVPGIERVAVLVDPANGSATESILRDVDGAAHSMGLQTQVLMAGTGSEIDAAFAGLAQKPADALFLGSGPFFTDRRVQLVLQAMLHKLPATFPYRDYPEVGGLMSYGASLRDAIRQAGVYTGRILKGAKPADLPVQQATKFELVINHQTARMLGMMVPQALLVAADEVIE